MSDMQAWRCHETSGIDALRWETLPQPQPGPGQVRLAVRAASLNFPDLLIVEGKYQLKPPLPFVPGSEYAGVVEAIGEGVAKVKPGDRVAAMGGTGGFATHAIVGADRLLPLPEAMSFDDGAAFAFTYGTVIHSLLDRGRLQAGETVLVLGASGGIGSAGVQIAKAAGARVVAAAAGQAKADRALAFGADVAIDYAEGDLRQKLKDATGGRGPDVVLDPVGGAWAEPVFRSIAWRGRYLVVGFAGGSIPALPWNLALLKGADIVGVFWGDFVRREPAAFAAQMRQLAQWHAQGQVRPVIDAVMPLAELPQAMHRMAARQVVGKLLVRPPST